MAVLSSEVGRELDTEIYDGEQITGPAFMLDMDDLPMHTGAEQGHYQTNFSSPLSHFCSRFTAIREEPKKAGIEMPAWEVAV